MDQLPELPEGGPPPGASYFAKLRALLRSMRLSVAPGCGLILTPGHGGIVLGFNRGPLPRIAITTGTMTTYNPTTKQLGQGPVALQRITLQAGGAFLVAVGGPPVTAYSLDVGSPAGTGIPAGRVLQLKVIDDVLVNDYEVCGAS